MSSHPSRSLVGALDIGLMLTLFASTSLAATDGAGFTCAVGSTDPFCQEPPQHIDNSGVCKTCQVVISGGQVVSISCETRRLDRNGTGGTECTITDTGSTITCEIGGFFCEIVVVP
jgi:hypothetical protein